MPTNPEPTDHVIAAVEYLQAARHHDVSAQEVALTVHGEAAVIAGLTEIALAVITVGFDADTYLNDLKRLVTNLRDHLTEGTTP